LAGAKFQGFQETDASFCVLLPESGGREHELRALVAPLGDCRVEGRPATLEDLYLAYMGFRHAT
jgi:hypothetical protein